MDLSRLLTFFGMAMSILLFGGCNILRATSHDQKEFSRVSAKTQSSCITASGEGWDLAVRWEETSLRRYIEWSHKRSSGTNALALSLAPRPKPWRHEIAGVVSIAFDGHQSLTLHQEGRRVDVTMRHGRVEYPTAEDLLNFLQWEWYGEPSRVALSSDGILAVLDVDYPYENHWTVNIEIRYLTLSGDAPPAGLLNPYLKGSVVQTRQTTVLVDPEGAKNQSRTVSITRTTE